MAGEERFDRREVLLLHLVRLGSGADALRQHHDGRVEPDDRVQRLRPLVERRVPGPRKALSHRHAAEHREREDRTLVEDDGLPGASHVPLDDLVEGLQAGQVAQRGSQGAGRLPVHFEQHREEQDHAPDERQEVPELTQAEHRLNAGLALHQGGDQRALARPRRPHHFDHERSA